MASVCHKTLLPHQYRATSTFAWYQVQTKGNVITQTVNENIASVRPDGEVEVDLPVEVELTNPTADLELAHYYAAGALAADSWYKGTPDNFAKQTAANTAGLYTAFHLSDSAKTLVHNDSATGASNALWGAVKVTIKAPDNTLAADGTSAGSVYAYHDATTGKNYTSADIPDLLNGQKIDVKLERGDVRYEPTTDTALVSGKEYYTRSGNAGSYTYTQVSSPAVAQIGNYYEKYTSRAMFYSLGTNNVTAAPTAAGDQSINDTTSAFELSNLVRSSTGTVLYFGIYVEGDNSNNPDLSVVSGDYKVTISKHA